MKNKTTVYLLGAVAFLVWGLIIYRVFAAVEDDQPASQFQISPRKISQDTTTDFIVVKDTGKLKLNYRNPFLQAQMQDTIVIPVKKISSGIRSGQHPINKSMNWSFIHYSGYIRNPDSRKLIALVTINGKSTMLSEKESAEHVTLVKNMQDSIRVLFDGHYKTLIMSPKTI